MHVWWAHRLLRYMQEQRERRATNQELLGVTRMITALAQAQTAGASGDCGCQGGCVGSSECFPTSRVTACMVLGMRLLQSTQRCKNLAGQVHGRDGLHDPASEGIICQVWPKQGTVLQVAALWCLCRTAGCCAGAKHAWRCTPTIARPCGETL